SVCLCIDQTGMSIARFAADAPAGTRILFVQHHAEGNMKRLEPQTCKIVTQLLHTWLMTDRWMWIGSAGWRIRRIFCAEAMDLVEMLGLRIIGLQVLVRDRPHRPRGRGPTQSVDLPKVLSAEAKEGGAVELGVAAPPVVGVWMELSPVDVPPHFSGAVLPLQVDRLRAPVVLLSRHIVAALYQQDAFTGWRQTIRERAASRSGSDNDQLEVLNSRHKALPYMW